MRNRSNDTCAKICNDTCAKDVGKTGIPQRDLGSAYCWRGGGRSRLLSRSVAPASEAVVNEEEEEEGRARKCEANKTHQHTHVYIYIYICVPIRMHIAIIPRLDYAYCSYPFTRRIQTLIRMELRCSCVIQPLALRNPAADGWVKLGYWRGSLVQ